MEIPHDESLARIISELDLNKDNIPATQGDEIRCAKDESIRHQDEKNIRVLVECIESTPSGVTTPPYKSCPAPPPPTPASPDNYLSPSGNGVHAQESVRDVLPPIGEASTKKQKDQELRQTQEELTALQSNSEIAHPPTVAEILSKEGTALPTVVDAPAEKKNKKKKKKSSSGKNKKAPVTGFEEYYADPPITPDEHGEESDLYSPHRPFHDRIQTCIQRYRARRKLDSLRSNILTKYFMLGGVDSSSKAFTGGLDAETLENSTAEEIAAIRAFDVVHTGSQNAKYYDPDNAADWVVDFEGVAKGFFAYRVPRTFVIDTEQDVKTYTAVIRNFLRYVLYHAVCTEYTEDIMAAIKVCDLAEKELWAIKQISRKLPGDFNVAASTLHGGRYQGLHMASAPWAMDDSKYEDFDVLSQGFSNIQAERIFKTAIALAGNDDLFVKVMIANVHIIKTEMKCYEIVDIERADIRTLDEFSKVKDYQGETGKIKALGSVSFKEWEGPGLHEEDTSDDEGAVEKEAMVGPVVSFWLEDEILQLCFVGMKLELSVNYLNIDLAFFDAIFGIYTSFHTVLANEKMTRWKEPVPNTRPPPTEDDPDVEERAIEATIEGDVNDHEKDFGDKKKPLASIPEGDAEFELEK